MCGMKLSRSIVMYVIMSSLQSFHFQNVGRVVIMRMGGDDDGDDELEG